MFVVLSIIAVIVSTFWIWLPILIIVLVRRSNKKNAVGEQVRQSAPMMTRETFDQYVVEREKLNQEIYAEVKKDKPNVAKLRRLVKEIEELSTTKIEVVRGEGMAGYSYDGAAVGGGAQVRAAAPVAYSTPEMKPAAENHSGLNAILYIGSLLVVAGVGALVASVMDDSVKMVVMLLIIAIFYVGGLLIRRDERLVVAGKALVGTALAIIPFLGFGFAGFLRIPGETAWLLTSVIGLFAYVGATVLLKSRVVAYLSMAFLISLTLSMSATLALPMMYYFMLVMLIGVIAGLVRMFAGKRVPELFSSVVDVTGRWLTLLTLLASLFFVGVAESQMYVWLFWLATVQAGMMWYEGKKLPEEVVFRLLAHAAVLVTCLEVFAQDLVAFGVAFLVTAIVHGFISIMLGALMRKRDRIQMEWVMGVIMMVLMMLAFLFVLVGGEERMAAMTCLVSILLVGLACGVTAAVHKKIGWLYGVGATAVVLPAVFGSWVLTGEARWDANVYYVVYLIGMVLTVGLRALVRKKDASYDVLGLTGMMVFGLTAVGCSLAIAAGYQILVLALFAAGFGFYGWVAKNKGLYEVAVYVGALTLCRMMGEMLSSMRANGWTHALTYTHIAALTLVGTSIWREREPQGKTRLGVAMAVLTVMVGVRALSASNATEMMFYPIWFLVQNVVFVVVGGLWRKKWMWVWGACGVGAAIMWFVRDMTFVWLIVLGFGLIGLVVWSLLRGKK